MFASEYGWTLEQFGQLNLTQVHKLSLAITKRNTVKFHAEASLHASLHNAKIKPLDEVLGGSESTFDEKSDKAFEEMAFKRLREAQLKNGR